jgi:hypothetical protein
MSFRGTLRGYQQQAVDAVLKRDHGVIQLPTGAGQTVFALIVTAGRKEPTLVLVHIKTWPTNGKPGSNTSSASMPESSAAGSLKLSRLQLGYFRPLKTMGSICKIKNTEPSHYSNFSLFQPLVK